MSCQEVRDRWGGLAVCGCAPVGCQWVPVRRGACASGRYQSVVAGRPCARVSGSIGFCVHRASACYARRECCVVRGRAPTRLCAPVSFAASAARPWAPGFRPCDGGAARVGSARGSTVTAGQCLASPRVRGELHACCGCGQLACGLGVHVGGGEVPDPARPGSGPPGRVDPWGARAVAPAPRRLPAPPPPRSRPPRRRGRAAARAGGRAEVQVPRAAAGAAREAGRGVAGKRRSTARRERARPRGAPPAALGAGCAAGRHAGEGPGPRGCLTREPPARGSRRGRADPRPGPSPAPGPDPNAPGRGPSGREERLSAAGAPRGVNPRGRRGARGRGGGRPHAPP